MMANFKTKREQMAGELQKLLAKGESLRKKDFERMMTDIIDTHAKREEEVREMLENFRTEEEMVAEKLRSLLTKGEEVRIRDFKKMMIDIKQGQEKRIQVTNESVTDQLRSMQEEVHTMLDNFKIERQSVASAWHQMLGLFRTGAEEPRVILNSGSNPDPNEYQQDRDKNDKK
jgi:nucleoid DNA-binding protein